jgi:hypothetical protein
LYRITLPRVESLFNGNYGIKTELLSGVGVPMARPKHRSQALSITVSLPAETHDYLVLLASRGKLGPSEQDVAAHILIREVDMMIAIDYHEKRLPKN